MMILAVMVILIILRFIGQLRMFRRLLLFLALGGIPV